ncbi:MAG: hypothetical protein AAGE93_19175 [Bacteroidota bacterium]
MKVRILYVIGLHILLSGIYSEGFAQDKITFNQHIAPIVHTNCTPCHRPGEAGPFSLITYEDVAKRAEFIKKVTQSRYMPPWHADPEFSHFLNERRLTQQEINLITLWVDQGAQEGKKKHRPKLPTYESGSHLRAKPDLVLTMNQPFQIPDTGTEEFRFFNIPTELPEDKWIKAIEFRPGNRRYVHHSRIMVDTTNAIRGIDGLSETDPRVYEFQETPLVDEFMYGWVPGNFPIYYPKGTARKLFKNSDLIVNIHYAPSSLKAEDQSSILFYFTDEPIEQEVKTLGLVERNISNLPFLIPANGKKTFYLRSKVLEAPIDIISVLPHMHFLGKSFRSFAIAPGGEVIPLVKINNWDFNWQTTYLYEELLRIPKGSVIYAEATYDNTEENPANPNYPPKDVTYGWNTTDEMCNLIIYYVDASEEEQAASRKIWE